MRFVPSVRLALLAALSLSAAALAQPSFTIRFDREQQPLPYTGRVYVVLMPRATASGPEPRLGVNNWFRPPQIISLDVTAVPPGGTVEISAQTPGLLGFPKKLAELTDGTFAAQAIARRSLDHPVPGHGPGDLYSAVALVSATAPAASPEALKGEATAPPRAIDLSLTSVVQPRPFAETDRIKLVEIISPRLRQHHGRDVKMRAAVVLPEGWTAEGTDTFPAVYYINGFGGDHRGAGRTAAMMGAQSSKVLFVVPDPTCYWGHNVFADSATNGPWATALIEELIPEVERRFRGPAAEGGGGGERRYVFGVSSGGWSSLWLQVTHPEAFAGCWAHVPDPVDFHDFQRINLYRPEGNMYKDSAGQRRPLARMGDRIVLYYDTFVAMETALGPGGQIASFEAVFSPKLPDGRPRPLFDRVTGDIDPETAKAWEAFDLRMVIEKRWPEIAPKLAGKIHVYAGAVDTFYLEGAVARLKESLARLGSDAEVLVVPGMAHSPYSKGLQDMARTIMDREAARK